jgi:hypothetical protein
VTLAEGGAGQARRPRLIATYRSPLRNLKVDNRVTSGRLDGFVFARVLLVTTIIADCGHLFGLCARYV